MRDIKKHLNHWRCASQDNVTSAQPGSSRLHGVARVFLARGDIASPCTCMKNSLAARGSMGATEFLCPWGPCLCCVCVTSQSLVGALSSRWLKDPFSSENTEHSMVTVEDIRHNFAKRLGRLDIISSHIRATGCLCSTFSPLAFCPSLRFFVYFR